MKRLSNEEIEAFSLDDDWRALDDENLRLLRIKVCSTWLVAMRTEHEDLPYWDDFFSQLSQEGRRRKAKK